MTDIRTGEPPIDILTRLLETDPEFMKKAMERGVYSPLPPAKLLRDLRRHEGTDPAELLRHRFLCRGASVLFAGPTGVGKSSLTMQLGISFSAGVSCFGFEPTGPMKVLIVQAENDEGDMAEMRDGVLNGIRLTDEQKEIASTRVLIVHEDSKTGAQFTAILDKLLEEHRPDLVFVDPAFSYLGGDASSQKEVSPFLRNLLNPVIHRHHVGLWLNHHTNKPAPAKGKAPPTELGAYLGAGSAEWCNWARAVVALQPVPKTRIYRLSAPKRGARLRWRDDDDQPIYDRFIAHAREPGVICWREAEATEVPVDSASKARTSVQDIVTVVGTRTVKLDELTREVFKAIEPRYVGSKPDSIRRTASRYIQTGLKSGALRETPEGICATAASEPCPNSDMSGHAEKDSGVTPS